MIAKTKTRGVKKAPVGSKAAVKKPPAPKGPSKKELKRAQKTEKLKESLLGLRGSLNEVQEQYGVRTHGLLVQMLQILEPPPDAKEQPCLPSKKGTELMVQKMGALKIKPKRGRGKDLVRIQDLVEALWILFPPQP
jgi:hypothetical protein